ncbi:MAG: hypothetical protein FWC26_02235 [Fibromonadales bacterium]|nr:hypothetical protein [Fibromonadales bacterium]
MGNGNEELCDECGDKLNGQSKYRDKKTLCEICYDCYEDTHAENCAECEIELDGQGEWYSGRMLCHDCIEASKSDLEATMENMLGDNDEEQAAGDWNEYLDR